MGRKVGGIEYAEQSICAKGRKSKPRTGWGGGLGAGKGVGGEKLRFCECCLLTFHILKNNKIFLEERTKQCHQKQMKLMALYVSNTEEEGQNEPTEVTWKHSASTIYSQAKTNETEMLLSSWWSDSDSQ